MCGNESLLDAALHKPDGGFCRAMKTNELSFKLFGNHLNGIESYFGL